MANLASRMRLAAKALTGLFTEQAATQAHGLLSGLYPASVGTYPQRGTRQTLEAYSQMPWLRAVGQKIAESVAATEWVLLAPANGKRRKIVQRAAMSDRRALVKAALDGGEMRRVADHLLLDALHNANEFLVGPALFLTSQIHLDFVGETFWIKERNGLGAPVGFWPIPPHWIASTPTPSHRFYRVAFSAWRGEIPDTEIAWFAHPDPANPYGRGSGIAKALSDEVEADEYAARHVKMTFLNRARPDLIVWPEETRQIKGEISEENAERLAERWRAGHQGFWRAAMPFFATRKLGVEVISQNFQELQIAELRKHERDIIIQTFGMPPEELGIIENSNRATIDASDFLYKKNLVVPRLEFLRAYIQERIVPEYDERLHFDYVSPVAEDAEFNLKVATAAPWSLTVDEWRASGGLPPLPDGHGAVHLVPRTMVSVADPSVPWAAPSAASPSPSLEAELAPAPAPMPAKLAAEWVDDAAVCREAADGGTADWIARHAADDVEDLPALARRVVPLETALRRRLAARMGELRARVPLERLEQAVGQVAGGEHDVAALARLVPAEAWLEEVGADLAAALGDGFRAGARYGAEAAGVRLVRDGVEWNRVNQEALAWARAHAAELLAASLGPATADGIRAAIVAALEAGLSARDAARLIRESVALTAAQARAVARFAARLAAEGVDEKRLAARVERYAEAQRRVRALVIARTEIMTAANAGQQRLWELAVERGALRKDRIRRKWLTAGDEHVEELCEALADEEAPLDEPFSDGTFQPPRHPQCRCSMGLVAEAAAAAAGQSVIVVRARIDLDAPVAAAVRAGLAPLAEAVRSLEV